MAESELTKTQKAPEPPRSWRQTVLAIGMFCLLGALAVGAAMKGQGSIPKLLGILGFFLMGVSILGSIVASLSSRLKSGQAGTVESKS